jgi:hypothetical protein
MADAQWLTPWPPAPWLAPVTCLSRLSQVRCGASREPRNWRRMRCRSSTPPRSAAPLSDPNPNPNPSPSSDPWQGLADQVRHHEALRGVDVALVWPREEAPTPTPNLKPTPNPNPKRASFA